MLDGDPGEIEVFGFVGQENEAIGLYHIGRDRVGADDEEVRAKKIATIAFSKNRSEEHTSELQSLMRISYAVFCLKKKKMMKLKKCTKQHRQLLIILTTHMRHSH